MNNQLSAVIIGDGVNFKSPFVSSISISRVVGMVLEGSIGLAGLIMLFLLLGAGWTIISSQGGNPEGMKKATKTATSAIVGMIVVVFAYLIVRLIEFYFFGFSQPFTGSGK